MPKIHLWLVPLNLLVIACLYICPSLDFGQQSILLAADNNPAIQKSIDRGVTYLKKHAKDAHVGVNTLTAYALFKAGVPANSTEVSTVINKVVGKIKNGTYKEGGHKIYTAGLDIMLLADAGKGKYTSEIEVITEYLINEQKKTGGWNYRSGEVGDTSVTQYALLGLWAAKRANVNVPGEVFDKAAKWHVATQQKDGGFGYMPGTSMGDSKGQPTLNLTAGGAGSLMICRLMLYPNQSQKVAEKVEVQEKKQTPNSKKFGLLKKVKVDEPAGMGKSQKKNILVDYKPQTNLASIEGSAKRGIGWLNKKFVPVNPHHFRMYYFYTMERTMALSNIETLQGKNWFDTCASALIQLQEQDGAWSTQPGKLVGTSFALLFLTRATSKLLGRPVGPRVAPGLLAGGRGLPDDLNDARMKNGKVEDQTSKDPLAALLKELEKPSSIFDESLQETIVEKIQLGDPEELIGQNDRIVKLVTNREPEIRRTAIWALARSGNLKDVYLIVRALKEENNVDILVEAYNALCFISHKPNGFGLHANPFENLPDNASQKEKDIALNQWRTKAYRQWAKWFLSVRPYDQQNDLIESELRNR